MAQDLNLNQRLIVNDTDGVRVTGITSGSYLEISGNLPGYTAGLYPTIKSGGTIHFAVNGAYSAYLEANDTYFGILDSNTVTQVLLRTNGISYLNGGNVGIGTTSPNGRLHVYGGRLVLDNAANAQTAIQINSAGTEKIVIYRPTSTEDLRIYTPAAGDAFSLTQAGNVGIGTAAPESLLHLSQASVGGDGAFLFIDNPAASTLGNTAGIRFATNAGASFSGYGSFIQAVNTNAVNGAESLTFGTWNGASRGERVRILHNGNVGIGTTSPDYKLTIGGIGTVGGLRIEDPTATTYGAHFTYIDANSKLSIGGFTNGTRNDTILIDRDATDTIAITSVGVGIGTTSPTNKLDVAGAIKIDYDGTYGTGYGAIGFGGLTNGYNRVFGRTNTGDGLFLASATGRGIYFRANGGSTDHMTVSSSGNVGIGITGPAKKLVVAASSQTWAGAPQIAFYDTTSGQTGARNWTVGAISTSWGNFTIASSTAAGGDPTTARLTITNAGNVGIGTTSPSHQFQIHNSSGSGSQMNFTDSTTTAADGNGLRVGWNGTYGQLYLFENSYLRFGTNNTERMRITSGGNVGIGTTSPSYKLDVNGTFKSAGIQDVSNALAIFINGNEEVGIGTTSPNNKLHVADSTTGIVMRIQNSSAGEESSLRFQALSSTSTQEYADIALDPQAGDGALVFRNPYTSERMRIDGSGNVGIGTTSPAAKLDVAGQIITSDSVRFTGNVSTPTGNSVFRPASNTLAFGTASAERMRIDASGNVGIGTTSPTEKLDVNGRIIADAYLGRASTSASDTGTGFASYDVVSSATGAGLYQITIVANPNSAGSSAYADYLYGKIIIGTGYSGSAVTHYIHYVQENPDPRSLYGSGGGNMTVEAFFVVNDVESSSLANGTTYGIRIKISGYTVAGAGTVVRTQKLG